MASTPKEIQPSKIRLDVSTVCQLRCPTCPTANGKVAAAIGSGFLKYSDFKQIIDNNSFIKEIELSNYGEIFLNPELIDMIKYAYEKNVAVCANNGANLNTMTDELIESLVKYRFKGITCSIDGIDNKTYQIYRQRGNFDNVINNIKAINRYKKKYNSPYPKLLWQFVAFGHNEGFVDRAREMAQDLGMDFFLKLSWGNMFSDKVFSPVKDKEHISKETGLGVANRDEYYQKYGVNYIRPLCFMLWKNPQINFDGRMLGCNVNFWEDYGNVFKDNLISVLNNEKMSYARSMLMGKKPARDDIPCVKCKLYNTMLEDKHWISWEEIKRSGKVTHGSISV
ncbi:putative Fe-S oxidoreductase, SAM radical superfamily [Methanosarcina barkeri str. Wiesmoor]|uniref:Radical SAM protein n=2 Tax=Methanosarcina barkeri TaxID=2208 RepID=Q46CV4_METBF|nr:radical SAM protein [Methanosarcina barkeri]AKB52652.1 putative Fe-S oxidoreductase, SAM radical superfamily [Methanosarcina barkeri str. Wiesmoor]